MVNALNASTHIKAPAPCLHLAATAQHAQPLTRKALLYSAEKLLKFCNVKGLSREERVDMGVWCWCFGGAVSTVYAHLLNTPVVMFLSAVYAGESSTNSTRECALI